MNRQNLIIDTKPDVTGEDTIAMGRPPRKKVASMATVNVMPRGLRSAVETTDRQGHVFNWRGLKALPVSFKLFISLFLCVAGFCYATLLASIWSDTEMNLATIAEAYATMGDIELIQHSFRYLFWFFGIFVLEGLLFLLTTAPERVKKIFSTIVPVLILADIGSAWFIRSSNFFAYTLFASGVLLATSFLVMFLWIQSNLWSSKGAKVTWNGKS